MRLLQIVEQPHAQVHQRIRIAPMQPPQSVGVALAKIVGLELHSADGESRAFD